MAKLTWDPTGKHYYQTGISQVALYVQNTDGTYETGVAWDGVTAVNENPSGADATDLYANNSLYASIRAAEKFGFTIEAYTSPEEFDECDGLGTVASGVTFSQQDRRAFALAYRTEVKNETAGASDDSYQLHIVYGCTASPSSKNHESINESPNINPLSWECSTVPVAVEGFKPTAHVVLDTTKMTEEQKTKLATIEKKLYGDTSAEPTLVMPSEIKTTFAA